MNLTHLWSEYCTQYVNGFFFLEIFACIKISNGVIDSTEADIFMPFFSLNTRWSLKIFTLFSWFELIWSNKSNFVYGMVKCFKDSSKRFATTDLNCTWLRGVNDTWHWRDRTVELLIGISLQNQNQIWESLAVSQGPIRDSFLN